MNLPNALTLARFLAVPVCVWLILRGEFAIAFGVFVAAGITDALDGYLARRLGAQTRLGQYLDPLADKTLLVCVFIALGYAGHMEKWLVILVVSRDVMIVGGVVLLAIFANPPDFSPSFSSKANTAVQIGFVSVVLARQGFELETLLPVEAVEVLGYLVAATTVWSGWGYARTWFRVAENVDAEREGAAERGGGNGGAGDGERRP